MNRTRNFSAGPGALPESVLAEAQRAVMALPGTGISILGLSHRIMVMRDGRAQKVLPCEVGSKPSQVEIVEHMV